MNTPVLNRATEDAAPGRPFIQLYRLDALVSLQRL